jgi:nuclear cap-binding protein subunit 2
VGNLAFVTTDVQLHALFSRAGAIDRVVMGINRETRAPCGFAFVIFMRRADALNAVAALDAAVLDERVIKVEVDKGFHEGKQYGRGSTGGQVRDELRGDYDEGRGGYGLSVNANLGSIMASPPSGGSWRGRGGGRGGGGGGGARGRRSSVYNGGSGGGYGAARSGGERSGGKRGRDEDPEGGGGGHDAEMDSYAAERDRGDDADAERAEKRARRAEQDE